jgi:hypothetical protein
VLLRLTRDARMWKRDSGPLVELQQRR